MREGKCRRDGTDAHRHAYIEMPEKEETVTEMEKQKERKRCTLSLQQNYIKGSEK